MTSNRTRIVTAVHQDQPMSHKLANDQNVAIASRPAAPVNPTPLRQSDFRPLLFEFADACFTGFIFVTSLL